MEFLFLQYVQESQNLLINHIIRDRLNNMFTPSAPSSEIVSRKDWILLVYNWLVLDLDKYRPAWID